MIISKPNIKSYMLNSISSWLPIALIFSVIVLMPSQAYAIDFPTITGISPTDGPITIAIKIGALILKGIIYFIFTAAFVAAAYVALTTLFQMAKDRDNAGDLVGKLMASLFVIVIVWWFADQGEQAADELKDIQLSYIETPNTVVAV